jgi:hypothetical protein
MQIYNQNYTKTVTIVTQVFFLFMLKKVFILKYKGIKIHIYII